MDDLGQYNRQRWNALAAAGVPYARPWLDLDEPTARQRVDPLGFIGTIAGKQVLCLAAGGGQQSAALALLGADVTVFDLSDEMLARDQAAAAHYKITVRTIRGDARDLSGLASDAFDVVWQGHSLPFIPQVAPLFDGVRRVLRLGGLYHTETWNPLAYGANDRWTGTGYLLQEGYTEGAEAMLGNGHWNIASEGGEAKRVVGPREFRHTLTAILNGLIARGFVLLDVHEEPIEPTTGEPGSWAHFCSVVPPWMSLWARWRPDLMEHASAT